MSDTIKDNTVQRQVTFYTKAGCHLCEDARDLLDELATEIPYVLTEIDIRRDMALFEQYRYRIPVILIDETQVLEGRITFEDLAEALQPDEEQR